MDIIMDVCFLCSKNYDCVPIHEKIVSQVEYLLPEITVIKLGVPLRICSACDGALCAFNKFKQSCVESSRRLEASIKGAQGPWLHTGSSPVVHDNELSVDKPEKMEETSIKDEYVEEIPLDTQMNTNRASLNRIVPLGRISVEPQNENMQLHADTNADNTEEITIKEEQMKETAQDREFYKILKAECVNNSGNDDTDSQSEHNTEDESATFNTSEEVWEGSYADFKEETLEKTDGNNSKNIQTDTNKFTNKTKDHRCNVCSKLFVSKIILTRHMKENHWRLRNLPCTVCKKIFVHKYDLNKHMDLHNGIMKFPCSICKKSFCNNSNLKQHLKHCQQRENKIKDSLSCPVCDKKFKYKYLVKRHSKIHTGVKDFQCEVCNKSFTRKDHLNVHIKSHSGVKDFQCDVCNKLFAHKNSLNSHIKLHSEVKDIQCGVCNKSFMYKSDMNSHMKIHSDRVSQNMQLYTDTNAGNAEEILIKEEQMEETPQDKEFYKIVKEEYASNSLNDDTDSQPEHNTEDESATFNTSEEVWDGNSADFKDETDGNYSNNIQTDIKIITHKTKHQDEINNKIQEKKEHRCNVCTKLFVSKIILTRHMKENHWRLRNLPCTVCKKIFVHKYDLNKHMDLHNGIMKFPCSICKKSFCNNSNLKQHLKHCQQKENKTQRINKIKDSLSCPVCDKKFKYKYLVKRHLKIHTGVKDFQCDVCNKSFTRKDHLNVHIKSHSGVKDFQCDVCNKLFTHKNSLNSHMKFHSDVKDFQCGVCNKSFTQRSDLNKHMKIHSRVKDFQCGVCNKSFTQKGHLNMHMKFHSEVKDIQCGVCNKSFMYKSDMNRHMKIHSDRVSQYMQLHTDTNAGNAEEILIKEEQMEETPQDKEFYKIVKEEYASNSVNDNTDSQPEHNTEDEIETFNKSEEVREGNSADFKDETVEETDGNYSKNIQTDIKIITHKTKHQDEINNKIQEKKEHRCNVCTKLFVSKIILTRHMKENHWRLRNLPCTVCKKIFVHKYDLNKHMDLHNGIMKFPCSICKKSFCNNSNLKQHLKHCQQKENNTQRINKIKDSLSCPVCDKKFKYKYLVKRHLKIHTGVKDFQCDVCNKSFTRKDHLNVHIKIHSGVKDFQCDVCNKLFTHKKSLNSHMKLHSEVKDIQCGACNKAFMYKSDMNSHLKIHSGMKVFHCDVCNNLFMRKESLICHMKLHSGVTDFLCDICNKSFARKSALTIHMKLHFGVKDFQCGVCKKSFYQKTHLNRHMKIHLRTRVI